MFALPFLIGFGFDWLAVSGVRFAHRSSLARLKALSLDRLPLLLRFLAVVLILAELSRFLGLYSGWLSGQPAQGLPYSQAGFLLLVALQSLVLVTLALGVSGRVAAILGLCLLGIQQLFASLTPAQIALALLYTAILYLGTGALSLWKPEDRLIFSRAGERPGESTT